VSSRSGYTEGLILSLTVCPADGGLCFGEVREGLTSRALRVTSWRWLYSLSGARKGGGIERAVVSKNGVRLLPTEWGIAADTPNVLFDSTVKLWYNNCKK